MDFNFKKYGKINVDDFIPIMETFDWDVYTFRQENFKSHTQTKSIRLIWDEMKKEIIYWDDYMKLKPLLDSLSEIFMKEIGPGFLSNAILVKMPPHTKVERHKDEYEFFDKNNRMHVPIITNDKCIFEVDGEEINMKIGEIWEINNFEKQHSVINNGDTERIHLIIDWSPNTGKFKKSLI